MRPWIRKYNSFLYWFQRLSDEIPQSYELFIVNHCCIPISYWIRGFVMNFILIHHQLPFHGSFLIIFDYLTLIPREKNAIVDWQVQWQLRLFWIISCCAIYHWNQIRGKKLFNCLCIYSFPYLYQEPMGSCLYLFIYQLLIYLICFLLLINILLNYLFIYLYLLQ